MTALSISKKQFHKEAKFILLNFLVLAFVGILLRYLQAHSIAFLNYKNLLEAHSHFAFSGVLLLSCITALRVSFEELGLYIKPVLFYIFYAESYLLLFIFSVYGYKAPGITASTLYLFTTYYLVYLIWKGSNQITDQTAAIILKVAALFLVLSTIALWCMAPLMALKFAGKPIYYNTVYFYLHFQYNGFFTFCIIAICTSILVHKNAIVHSKQYMKGIFLFALATLLTYFISTLWCNPTLIFRLLAIVGALLQIYSILLLYFAVDKKAVVLSFSFNLKTFIIVAFCLKIILMFYISIPFLNTDLFSNRHLIIVFLHLTFIGTLWLSYWYFMQRNLFDNSFENNKSMRIFLVFFFFSELFLFSSILNLPISASSWNLILMLSNIGMFIGIASLLKVVYSFRN